MNDVMKPTRQLQTAMLIASIVCSMTLLYGCARKVVVIDGTKAVTRLPLGQTFTAPQNGYFVPDARMKEILDRLAEREAEQAQADKK